MKFLFASDSFKGSLTTEQIISILTESARKIFPECECIGIPVADGGEGTVESVIAAAKGMRRSLTVHGPLMEEVEAYYGVLNGTDAVIEMAAASGLPLVPEEKKNPMNTTTYGTGELIRDALDHGYRNITVAIGGSATNDGGMGAMRALGIRFLDEKGNLLDGYGRDLVRVKRIDCSELHPAVAETTFTVMSDVTNPLTGPEGATYTFGRQKGATPKIQDIMEAGMKQYAQLLEDCTGIKVDRIPGAGAAGGLGAALKVFLHAQMRSGIDTVLDLVGFDDLLEGVDLVITGEGRIDWQSSYGKVPGGVGLRCKKKQIPVIAIVGEIGPGADAVYDKGIQSMISTVNRTMSLAEAMERSEELYRDTAERLFRILSIGFGNHII